MLRSRSGVHRQAVHGLTMDASASCLASRQAGASLCRSDFAVLGAETGRNVKSQIKSQVKSTATSKTTRHSRESESTVVVMHSASLPFPLAPSRKGRGLEAATLLMLPLLGL